MKTDKPQPRPQFVGKDINIGFILKTKSFVASICDIYGIAFKIKLRAACAIQRITESDRTSTGSPKGSDPFL
jgi:hypothetical protein